MTDDEIIALKYQHGIEASVPPDVTRSALKQFLDCAEASHIESGMNIMAVCTHTGLGFVIYNRTSDMPCPYAEEALCKCVIVQHRFGGLCTVRFTDNKDIFTIGVVHKDDAEIKRFTKYATEWDKKPSRIIPANPEPMPNRSIRMRNEATISEHGHYLLGTHTSDVHYREFLRYIAKVSDPRELADSDDDSISWAAIVGWNRRCWRYGLQAVLWRHR